MHKILVVTLYFPLIALNVSDYISPSSGATLKAVQLVYTGIYQMLCTAYKVAPDDGLI